MKLYLKHYTNKILWSEPKDDDEAYKDIQNWLTEHYPINHYMRHWVDNAGVHWIDFGSHTDFFCIEGEQAMSYNKEEDLKLKYAYIPDDAANAPASKKKKTSPKKANHKHNYDKSIIINYYDKYTGKWTYSYRNICTVCGRIGDFKDKDGIIAKTFPHIGTCWFGFSVAFGYNAEFEEFTEWSKTWYPVIVWKDYQPLSDKFIPNEFFDELKIGTDKVD